VQIGQRVMAVALEGDPHRLEDGELWPVSGWPMNSL
jgi:hypothetical protein